MPALSDRVGQSGEEKETKPPPLLLPVTEGAATIIAPWAAHLRIRPLRPGGAVLSARRLLLSGLDPRKASVPNLASVAARVEMVAVIGPRGRHIRELPCSPGRAPVGGLVSSSTKAGVACGDAIGGLAASPR